MSKKLRKLFIINYLKDVTGRKSYKCPDEEKDVEFCMCILEKVKLESWSTGLAKGSRGKPLHKTLHKKEAKASLCIKLLQDFQDETKISKMKQRLHKEDGVFIIWPKS